MFPIKSLILLLNKKYKTVASLFFVFFILSCSNYTFVYSNGNIINFLKDTSFSVEGEDIDLIKSYLLSKKRIGKDSNSPEKYQLKIISRKESRNAVIENDLTASLIEIQYILEYTLYDKNNNCITMKNKIKTTENYNSRAEGFDFGSDLSEGQVSRQLIEDNIDKFIQSVMAKSDSLDCN